MHEGIPERGLGSAAELFADYEHGTRGRYLAGCKCFYCRRANSDYFRERKLAQERGDWNGIVSAIHARRHIRALSRAGIGRRRLSELSGVGDTVIQDIKAGRKQQIRARTERLILAVTDIEANATGSTLVPAGPTWELIDKLLAEGFTKRRIAQELGSKSTTPALQLARDYVTAANAKKVRALVRRYAILIE